MRALIPFLMAVGSLLPGAAAAQFGPLPVDVATPKVAEIVDWDEYTGQFEAVQRVELRARVSGYLQEIRFRDGQEVEVDDVLFVVDPRQLKAEYARFEAELQSARAAQSLAETQLRRNQELRGNNTIAQATLDEAIANKASADAQVAIAEAALEEAQLDLQFTEVKAPFSGRISDSRVDAGNLVVEGQTVLATLVSTDPIHFVMTASEADFLKYARLSRGGGNGISGRFSPSEVQARLIDEKGWPHKGALDYVANELDPNAGTITGRAVFDNEDGLLTPGLFARARIIASEPYEAILIPDTAILSDQSRKIVMVVDDEATVSAKVVEPGPLYRGLRVIRSGLEASDRIVITGVQRARPGGQVVPQEAEIDFLEPAADLASSQTE